MKLLAFLIWSKSARADVALTRVLERDRSWTLVTFGVQTKQLRDHVIVLFLRNRPLAIMRVELGFRALEQDLGSGR